MEILRQYLGSHQYFRDGQLTKREVAMLIICAGREAGFTSRTDISTPTFNSAGEYVQGEIDVGWFDSVSQRLVVAWEIDGQDASKGRFIGASGKGAPCNIEKFKSSDALLNVQVLYSVKNDLTPKRTSKKASITEWLAGAAQVVSDEELYAENGIEEWMQIACDQSASTLQGMYEFMCEAGY